MIRRIILIIKSGRKETNVINETFHKKVNEEIKIGSIQ